MTSTIQSLCVSIPETLLHVTLKRRAEISADIFACLLRYFFLSCKNLTIMNMQVTIQVLLSRKVKISLELGNVLFWEIIQFGTALFCGTVFLGDLSGKE